jgi:hypothetical protein
MLWWVVSAPDRTVIDNDDFTWWFWLVGILGAVLIVATGYWRRSVKSTVLAGLGVVVALALELAMFMAWIVTHSQ